LTDSSRFHIVEPPPLLEIRQKVPFSETRGSGFRVEVQPV
jgi:hypothetical protein